ncbi:AvrD family protein [Streptomyces sp. NPDC053560]|uniref:AvrD family protein n=1 Tax=Streptomyces sp. NPDC053560 TaxID=3365711 RepID=UPI0037D6D0BD
MSVQAQTRPRGVDDLLGPGEGRFFGAGFRRIRHTLTALTADAPAPGTGTLRATVGLHYPGDWSSKPGQEALRPHLSSVDALVIGVQLCEVLLAHAYGLGAEERRVTWLRGFEMRSGANPQEELADFAVSAELVSTEPVADPLSRAAVSTLRCRVGSIKVRYEIAHPPGDHRTGTATYTDAVEALGPAEHRFYGERYKRRLHRIEDIATAAGTPALTALVAVRDEAAGTVADPGLGGAFPQAVSMVDSTIVLAQMAQVLLYELDGIGRAESDTLWMRRIHMTAQSPLQPMLHPFVAATSIVRHKTLPMGGDTWRTADFAGDVQGIHAEYALAHRLPRSAARPH